MVLVTQFIDMDYEFFEKLSKSEANAYFQLFLETESSKIKATIKKCAADGIKMDFSLKSLPPFIRWVLKRMVTIPLKPDPSAPEWIRSNEVYNKRLFEFDDASNELILEAAYYLGECFMRTHSSLTWDLGDIKTAEGNMPVIAGFEHGLEMAPILVMSNLLRGVTAEPKKIGDIEIMVDSWNKYVQVFDEPN